MKHLYFGMLAWWLLPVAAFCQKSLSQNQSNFSTTFFISNKGQVRDQYKNSRSDIDFMLHGNGLNIFISAGRIHYQFADGGSLASSPNEKFAFPSAIPMQTNRNYNLYRLDMELSGANLQATAQMEDVLTSEINYYVPGSGTNGITHVNTCRKIVYPEIYPGIDWVLYFKDGSLKYDFVLHNAAAANRIIIQYKGATDQKLDQDGRLHITTPLGTITEDAPLAWTASDHKGIKAAFTAGPEGWAFALAPWKGSLVLDPGLSWSTYYGGSGMDIAKDVLTRNNSVYVTGLTTSLNQIATTGTYQTNFYGGVEGDAFLARFTSDGTLLWATYFGGDSNDLGWQIVTDASENIYMAGYTESGVGIATAGSQQPIFGGGTTDAFLAKFSSTGQRVWSTYYGGSGPDYGHSIAIDGDYLYTCGMTYSNMGMATTGSYQPALTTSGGNTGNGFLVKWDLDGNRQWATYYGAGTTTASSVVADANHGIYIAGGTNAPTGISTPGSHQVNLSGLNDNFMAKFNTAGQRQWGTYFGGIANESTFPVLLAGEDDKIYLAGITYSYSQIATPGTSRSLYSNGIDGYLSSFTTNGVQEWGTYVGPGNVSNGIYIADIASGNCGDVFVTGDVYPSVGLTVSPDAYQQTAGGGSFDGALIRYDRNGQSNYCTYIGGSYEDNMSAITMSKDGNLYLAGITQSESGIAAGSSHQSAFGGVKDAFLMKFLDVLPGDKGSPDVIIDTVQCINDTFVIPYTITAPFAPGNVFTAELSDANGSFANALTIGTKTGSSTGFISCSIPQTVMPGGGYRIRLAGSNPATKGNCTIPLWLNLPPVPEITIHGDTLISTTANSYQWIKNGVALNGATNQRLVTQAAGWYKVKVTDPVTGCSAYSDSVAIGNVGISYIADIRSMIDVYPNPTGGKCAVRIASSLTNLQDYRLIISTPLGSVIREISGLQHHNQVDISALADGVYFLEVKGPAGKGVFRIVKQAP